MFIIKTKTINSKSIMNKLMILSLALFTSASLCAQQRASPAQTASASVNGNTITIKYSSPSVKGRTIWGGLEAYDKVWRTGANEATTIEVTKDCKIAGNDLKAGKYALFTIPTKGDWTVIINSEPNQWGAYKYDQSQDVLRFTVTPKKVDLTEMLTFNVDKSGTVTFAWEKLSFSFDVK